LGNQTKSGHCKPLNGKSKALFAAAGFQAA